MALSWTEQAAIKAFHKHTPSLQVTNTVCVGRGGRIAGDDHAQFVRPCLSSGEMGRTRCTPRFDTSNFFWRSRRLLLPLLLASCSGPTPPDPRAEAACYAELEAAGVRFQRVPQRRAPGIAWPIALAGSVDGLRVYGGAKDAPTNYLDCRLAIALVEWAPQLERAGVIGLQHYSMYRRDSRVGQSTKKSGHALGRAIDVAYFYLRDGSRLSVLDDWKNRERGVEPCSLASSASGEKLMRELVCTALAHELFQTVLTPHYNAAHKNHLHLEVADTPGGEPFSR